MYAKYSSGWGVSHLLVKRIEWDDEEEDKSEEEEWGEEESWEEEEW